jgi:L-ribulokinase
MSGGYVIGLDYGTNSVRALVVDVTNGRELSSSVWNYSRGEAGIILDRDQPDLARQSPLDYVQGIRVTVAEALEGAKKDPQFSAKKVIGIGVDTTGSTPMPIDRKGQPLCLQPSFADDLNALAWLWKDHTSHREASEITALAEKERPQYLAKCGGRYSSEWFWAKLLHCARVAPNVFDAAYTWVEIADWIPAILAGVSDADQIKRGICAAGHKAMFHPSWGGYPDAEFLGKLDPRLAKLRQTLPNTAYNAAQQAGGLSKDWADQLGLPTGIPIAIGAFDAHYGAIGAGIGDGTLVKIIGTSTCDIMVSPQTRAMKDVPGLCGIVPESVLPGHLGLEAGQSAVGDIFNWFVSVVKPANMGHDELTKSAEQLRPGESGLLALDWNNGNRTILVDQRLTGLMLGMTLHTTPGEMYRALIEATAMGARAIMERLEEYGVPVKQVSNCGGIAARNPLAMQIYADVMNRPIGIARTLQTCALGSAIVASVAAGAHKDFTVAVKTMAGEPSRVFNPNPANVAIYEKLYKLYRQLHDAFGVAKHTCDLSNVMKDLLDIRDSIRGH